MSTATPFPVEPPAPGVIEAERPIIPGPIIIVRTVHYFGAGPTVEAALAECRKAGGARNLQAHGYAAHLLPPGVIGWSICGVTGAISWEVAPGLDAGRATQIADNRKRPRAKRGGKR